MRERLHNTTQLESRRKKLRRNLTPAEAFLWIVLKNSNLCGRKFRRQHSIGHYILDFYCDSEKLAVELDGEVHRTDAAAEYDHKRKLFLNGLGIKVIRFENFLVFEDIVYVMHRIESFFGWQNVGISTTPSADSALDSPPCLGGVDAASAESASDSPPCLGGVDAASADGVVVLKKARFP